MGSLRAIVPRAGGMGAVASGIMVAGRLAVLLGLGLVIVLALTGTFAQDRYRDAAQTVLMILLGRKNKPENQRTSKLLLR